MAVKNMTSTITIQLTTPCIHQNGDITGYKVMYGVAGSGSTQNIRTEGDRTEISGLEISTNYSIEVAAVNSVGVGEYSDPITVLTQSKFCRFQTDIFTVSHYCSCSMCDSS